MKKSLIGLLCFVIVIAICIFTKIGLRNYYSNFTPEKWEKHERHRYSMVKSLESQHNIVGMTENEVKEILGEPTHIDDDFFVEYENQYLYDYTMGEDSYYWITFENGKVVEARIHYS